MKRITRFLLKLTGVLLVTMVLLFGSTEFNHKVEAACTVTTHPAQNITQTTALLAGYVEGPSVLSPATVSFEYGPTDRYGDIASPTDSSMSSDGYFAAQIVNLDSGQTYHFRARAVQDGTAYYGEDRTFTTTFTPPTIETLSAISISTQGAGFGFYLSSLGSFPWVRVHFEYGLTTSYGNTVDPPACEQLTGPATVIYGVGGLQPNTTYHYRAVVSDPYGRSWAGSDVEFTTFPISPEIQTLEPVIESFDGVVTVWFRAEILSFGSYTHGWAYWKWGLWEPVNFTDLVYREETGLFEFGMDLDSFEPGETYWYAAVLKDPDGRYYSKNGINFTVEVPPGVTASPATNITSNGATLNANLVSMGTNPPAHCFFQYFDASGETIDYTDFIVMTDTGAFSHTLTGLDPDTTYSFEAVALDDAADLVGLSSKEFFTTTTTQPPTTTTPPPTTTQPPTTTTPPPTTTTLPPPDGTQITFPDPNLEAAIREAINEPDGPIYQHQLESLTILNASERGISDLTGLGYCINLEILDLHSNNISDISPLAGLTSLQLLYLADNNISNVSPLSGLTNLQFLFLGFNHISDISPLAGLVNLETLGLYQNNISDISPLAGLTNLRELFLAKNSISDISPLAGLNRLQLLHLSVNYISDITPLVENSGLGAGDEVWLAENDLNLTAGSDDMQNIGVLEDRGVIVYIEETTTLPPPDGTQITFPDPNLEAAIREAINEPDGSIYQHQLESLTTLSASERGISDLTGLGYCINLETLDLHKNNISDISPLAGLTKLEGLWLPQNDIGNITPLAGLTNLQLLFLGSNNISDISPLAGLVNLETLGLFQNNISDISPLAGLTNLQLLFLSANYISDITPLIENSGLNTGDEVWLAENDLDLTAGSEDMQNIGVLEDRGVTVNMGELDDATLPEPTFTTDITPVTTTTLAPPSDTTIQEYELTINTLGNGNAFGAGIFPDGVKVAIVAIPGSDEWVFDRWTGDISMVDDPNAENTHITIHDNCHISANFKQEEEAGFPMWIIGVIIGGVVLLSTAGYFIYHKLRYKT